jgi:hypothetical protein
MNHAHIGNPAISQHADLQEWRERAPHGTAPTSGAAASPNGIDD